MTSYFTTQEEHDLHTYRINVKKELTTFAETNYSEIANKLIKLFHAHMLASTLFGADLKKTFTEDELKILIELCGEQFKKDYSSGLHYVQYETSWYGWPLVMEQGSSISGFARGLEKLFYPNTITNSELDVLIIHLSNIMEDFYGKEDGNPTNFDKQKEIIESFLRSYYLKVTD